MLASRRWRDWNPAENSQKGPECELTKPPKPFLSVLSVPTLAIFSQESASQSMSTHDPAEWRKPFNRWLKAVCVRHSRAFGGVSCMHLAFCEWAAKNDDVPCTRDTFERLLSELGFLIGEVGGVVLVSGLILRQDLDCAQAPECTPQPVSHQSRRKPRISLLSGTEAA
jgi:hypothetical protein